MKTHTKIEMKEMMDRKKENISGKGDKEGKDLEGGEGRGGHAFNRSRTHYLLIRAHTFLPL